MIVTTEVLDADILTGVTASVAAVGTLVGAKMRLFTNNVTPNKVSVVGTFTEAAYTGYAAQVITWTPPSRDSNGKINIETQLLLWQETTTPVVETIYGVFCTNSAGTVLYFAELFAEPFILTDLLSLLKTVTEFIQSNNLSGQTTIIA